MPTALELLDTETQQELKEKAVRETNIEAKESADSEVGTAIKVLILEKE